MSAASILKAIAKLTDKGFPEEVAERIAKGELPMDPASVAKRADEQGYGGVLYRGHDTAYPPKSDQDMWMSSSLNDAETYARARGTQYTDGSIDGAGTVTPLRTNADYHGINNLAYVRGDNKMYDKVTTNDLKNPGIRQGIIRGTDDISEAVRDSGQYQGTHFRNIKDEFHVKSSTEPSDVYNILGSRPDVKIRHPDAAFDPQYKGSNIMGGAAGTAGLTGLLAAGQSDDSEASVASLAKRGLKLAESRSDGVDGPDSLFKIVDGKDKEIGGAEFWVTPGGDYNAYAMRLYPEHRGTGIMNEAYDAIEEISGRKIEPSDVLTEDGMKFWIRRDPRKMQKLYERERFDYYEKDVLDSIFAEALEARR